MPPIRNQQQPVQCREIKNEAAHIADAKAVRSSLPQSGRREESRSHPCESGNPDLWKCSSQQKPRENGERIATANKGIKPQGFHRAELCLKWPERQGGFEPRSCL